MTPMSSPSTPEPSDEPTFTAADDPSSTPTTVEAPTSQAPTSQIPTTQAQTAPEPAVAEPAGPRGIRMRTVVFGLVLLAIAGSVLVGQLSNVSIDGGAVFLGLMISCGVLLIVGARRS
jgi:hypothetical protein